MWTKPSHMFDIGGILVREGADIHSGFIGFRRAHTPLNAAAYFGFHDYTQEAATIRLLGSPLDDLDEEHLEYYIKEMLYWCKDLSLGAIGLVMSLIIPFWNRWPCEKRFDIYCSVVWVNNFSVSSRHQSMASRRRQRRISAPMPAATTESVVLLRPAITSATSGKGVIGREKLQCSGVDSQTLLYHILPKWIFMKDFRTWPKNR